MIAKIKFRAVLTIAIAMLLGVACATAFSQEPQKTNVTATAQMLPAEFADLAASVSETIQRITVEEGDVVKKGQLLAILESKLPLAKFELAKVVASNNPSEQSRSELKVAKENLNRYLIRAPFDGQITQVHFQAGNFAPAGTPIVAMMNSKSLIANLNLPLGYWGKLKVGGQYKLRADKPVSKIIMGQVTHISRVVDSRTNTFRVRFEIENFTSRLPVGFNVRLNQKLDDNVVASK